MRESCSDWGCSIWPHSDESDNYCLDSRLMGETALDLTKNLDTMNTMWGNEIRKNKFKCV